MRSSWLRHDGCTFRRRTRRNVGAIGREQTVCIPGGNLPNRLVGIDEYDPAYRFQDDFQLLTSILRFCTDNLYLFRKDDFFRWVFRFRYPHAISAAPLVVPRYGIVLEFRPLLRSLRGGLEDGFAFCLSACLLFWADAVTVMDRESRATENTLAAQGDKDIATS